MLEGAAVEIASLFLPFKVIFTLVCLFLNRQSTMSDDVGFIISGSTERCE